MSFIKYSFFVLMLISTLMINLVNAQTSPPKVEQLIFDTKVYTFEGVVYLESRSFVAKWQTPTGYITGASNLVYKLFLKRDGGEWMSIMKSGSNAYHPSSVLQYSSATWSVGRYQFRVQACDFNLTTPCGEFVDTPEVRLMDPFLTPKLTEVKITAGVRTENTELVNDSRSITYQWKPASPYTIGSTRMKYQLYWQKEGQMNASLIKDKNGSVLFDSNITEYTKTDIPNGRYSLQVSPCYFVGTTGTYGCIIPTSSAVVRVIDKPAPPQKPISINITPFKSLVENTFIIEVDNPQISIGGYQPSGVTNKFYVRNVGEQEWALLAGKNVRGYHLEKKQVAAEACNQYGCSEKAVLGANILFDFPEVKNANFQTHLFPLNVLGNSSNGTQFCVANSLTGKCGYEYIELRAVYSNYVGNSSGINPLCLISRGVVLECNATGSFNHRLIGTTMPSVGLHTFEIRALNATGQVLERIHYQVYLPNTGELTGASCELALGAENCLTQLNWTSQGDYPVCIYKVNGNTKEELSCSTAVAAGQLPVNLTAKPEEFRLVAKEPGGDRTLSSLTLLAAARGISLSSSTPVCEISKPNTHCNSNISWSISADYPAACVFKNGVLYSCDTAINRDLNLAPGIITFEVRNGALPSSPLLAQQKVVTKYIASGSIVPISGMSDTCVPLNGLTSCTIDVNVTHWNAHSGATLYKNNVSWSDFGLSTNGTPFTGKYSLTADQGGTHWSLRTIENGVLKEFASVDLFSTTLATSGYELVAPSSQCEFNPLETNDCEVELTWKLPALGGCIFEKGIATAYYCPPNSPGSGDAHIKPGTTIYQLRESNSPTSALKAQVAVIATEQIVSRISGNISKCTSPECKVNLTVFTNSPGNICLYDNDVKVTAYCGLYRHSQIQNYALTSGDHKLQLVDVTDTANLTILDEINIEKYTSPVSQNTTLSLAYDLNQNRFDLSWTKVDFAYEYKLYKGNQLIYSGNLLKFSAPVENKGVDTLFRIAVCDPFDCVVGGTVIGNFPLNVSSSSESSSSSSTNSNQPSSSVNSTSVSSSSEGYASSTGVEVLNQPLLDPLNDALDGDAYLGGLSGMHSVGNDGSFNYNLPIVIPPGINGIQPKLALSYSSNAKNGLLGWGWSLDGLSQISRCNASPVRDGYASGIQSNDKYKYCLDGQRLVEIAAGEYRLESESFLRIKKIGEYWEVIANSGLKSRYGYNADSKTSDDLNQTYAWYLDQQQDSSSNSWSVIYTKTTEDGFVKHYPSSINYTKNTLRDSFHTIIFHYEDRNDTVIKYNAGAKTIIQQRLAQVEVKSNNVTQYSYILSYQLPSVNYHGIVNTDPAKTSRLAKLQQCFGSSTSECAAPLEFDWSEQTAERYKFVASGLEQEAIADSDTADDKAKLYVDANGDGILEPYFNADSSQWVTIGTGINSKLIKPNYKRVDVNSDGFDDVIKEYKTQTGIEVYLSNGSQINTNPEPGFSVPVSIVSFYSGVSQGCFSPCLTVGNNGRQIPYETNYVDMNADGLLDLVRSPYHCPEGLWCTLDNSPGDISVALNTGTGFGDFFTWANNWKGLASFCVDPPHPEHCQMGMYKLAFVDINGDGLTDFMAATTYPSTEGNHLTIGYNNGAQEFTIDYLGFVGLDKFLYGDFNGDGLIDIASIPQKAGRNGHSISPADLKITIRYGIGKKDSASNGTIKGFTAPVDAINDIGFIKYCGNERIPTSNTAEDFCFRSVKDINSDGLDDILEWGGRLTKVCVSSPVPSDLSLCSKWDRTYTEFDAKAYVSVAGGFAQPVTYKDFQTLSEIGATFISASAKVSSIAFDDYDNNGTYEDDPRLKNKIESNRIKRVLESSRTIAIDYLSMASSNIYLSDTSPTSLSDGEQTFSPARAMAKRLGVKEIRVTNGADSTNRTEYKYLGAKRHGAGYGDLGFAEVEKLETIEGQTPLKTVTKFYQKAEEQYKLSGRVRQQLVYTSNASGESLQLLSDSRNQWKVRTYSDDLDTDRNSPHYFAYLYQSSNQSWDLDGTKIADSLAQNHAGTTVSCDVLAASPEVIVSSAGSSDDVDYSAEGVLLYSQTATCDQSDSSASVQISAVENLDITSKGDARGLVQKSKQYAWIGSAISSASKSAFDVRTQAFTYNSLGQLESKTIEPDSATPSSLKLTTTYAYNGYGSVSSITDTWDDVVNDGLTGNSRVTTITETYDTNGVRKLVVTKPLNISETTEFHPLWGAPTKQTDANGLVTNTLYDAQGRPTTINYADDTSTQISYRTCSGCFEYHTGEVWYKQVKTTGSAAVRVYYDGFNREIGSRSWGMDGNAVYSVQTYNSRGNTYQATAPFYADDEQKTVTTDYDALGRVSTISYPDNSSEIRSYSGLIHTTTNRLNQTQTRHLNAAGWVMKSVDNANTPVDFTYWPFGDLKTTQVNNDPKTLVSVVYDKLGRKTEMTDPNTGKTTYTYNALDLVATQTDAKNQRTCFGYDALGRQTKRVDNATSTCTGTTQNWVYDTKTKGKGQLGSMSGFNTDGTGYSEQYSYTNYGLPESTTTSFDNSSYTVTQHYDSYNRPLGVTYPTGYVAANSYNSYGHLEQVKDSTGTTLWTANDVDALGNLEQFTLGNGVVTTQTYDANTSRIESIRAVSGSLVIQDQHYQFDALGNLNSREDRKNSITQSFCYDGLNRLKAARFDGCSSAANDYNYDPLGNLTTKEGLAGTLGYGTDGSNVAGPHAVTRANGWSYKYDAIGNLESATKAGEQTKTVSYSPFNTPTSITQGSKFSTLVYGPNQDRIKHSDSNGRVTKYVGGIYEEVTKGDVTQKIHYVGDFALFIQTGGTTPTNKHEYLHRDHIGSIVAISKGNIETTADVNWQANGAWGERRYQQWNGPLDNLLIPTSTAHGFTDHEHLDAVGLIHMNGRVYDPELGRFMSADPFVQAPYNSQSYNRYSYVFNNPLSFTDPSGFTGSCGYSGCGREEVDVHCDSTCMQEAREQQEAQQNAISQSNIAYWSSWTSQQRFAADVSAGMLVGRAMLNGGSTVWNGVQLSVQGYSATGGMVVTGGGTAAGEGVLGNLLKGVRLGNPLAVLALALTPTKIGDGTLSKSKNKDGPAIQIFRVVNNTERNYALTHRKFPPALSGWGEKQFWQNYDQAKKWASAVTRAGWEKEVTILSTLVTGNTFSMATKINEPGIGIFISFGPESMQALNTDTERFGVYKH
jgi:RHS repeat-associated protein